MERPNSVKRLQLFASALSFAGLVVLARSLNPIPSRTRPLNSSAPMVLWLKPWESRSLPGLQRTNASQSSPRYQQSKPPRPRNGTRRFCVGISFKLQDKQPQQSTTWIKPAFDAGSVSFLTARTVRSVGATATQRISQSVLRLSPAAWTLARSQHIARLGIPASSSVSPSVVLDAMHRCVASQRRSRIECQRLLGT